MANENKNINELVSEEDDPTAELEIPPFAKHFVDADEQESDANTFNAGQEDGGKSSGGISVSELESDLRNRTKTIGRLQFDIEQLHAKWLGLEAEIKARESLTATLNEELRSLEDASDRKDQLIRKRDQSINVLKAEIRQRDEEFRTLSNESSELQSALANAEEQIKKSAEPVILKPQDYELPELQERLERSEKYADSLRHQLQEFIEAERQFGLERDRITEVLQEKTAQNSDLDARLHATEDRATALQSELDAAAERHESDIRKLRFELGEAQDTIVGEEKRSAALSAELVDTQGVKDKLERLKAESESQSHARIGELRDEIDSLERQHTAEVDHLKVDLGAAKDSVAGAQARIEQLTSELADTVTARDEFDRKLVEAEKQSAENNAERQKQLQQLESEHKHGIQALQSQLTDAQKSIADADSRNQHLSSELTDTVAARDDLERMLDAAEEQAAGRTGALQKELSTLATKHEEEIRLLRFELGEAQETVAENQELNSQLASELSDTREFREELEKMLRDAEEHADTRIRELQKEVRKLAGATQAYEEKLKTKSEAITVLLAELAKKSEQLDSIGEIEGVIHDIDDRMSERIDAEDNDANVVADRNRSAKTERITRLLVGSIDGQVLRFPLFKDRLTIGRNEDNDIQLKADYISRQHAVIQTDGDATRIIDWGSKNGVYVNSERVKEHFLKDRDIVSIGNARFRYDERKKRDT